jgi:hypothetical protein
VGKFPNPPDSLRWMQLGNEKVRAYGLCINVQKRVPEKKVGSGLRQSGFRRVFQRRLNFREARICSAHIEAQRKLPEDKVG